MTTGDDMAELIRQKLIGNPLVSDAAREKLRTAPPSRIASRPPGFVDLPDRFMMRIAPTPGFKLIVTPAFLANLEAIEARRLERQEFRCTSHAPDAAPTLATQCVYGTGHGWRHLNAAREEWD